jgi:hypothetical protein
LNIVREWILDELGDGELVLPYGDYNNGGLYAQTPTGLNN